MYDFMRETVIMCTFMVIIMLDIIGFGYWISKLVKWIRKKIRKHKGTEDMADAESKGASPE